MQKHEFEERFGQEVSREFYHVVEAVYMNAEWVSDVDGKKEVADWSKIKKNREAIKAIGIEWGRDALRHSEIVHRIEERHKEEIAGIDKEYALTNQAYKKDCQALRDQIGQLQAEIQSIAYDRDEAVSDAGDLEVERDELKQKLSGLEKCFRDLKSENDSLQERNRILKAQNVLNRMKESGFTDEDIEAIKNY